jgi:hypothetical protein
MVMVVAAVTKRKATYFFPSCRLWWRWLCVGRTAAPAVTPPSHERKTRARCARQQRKPYIASERRPLRGITNHSSDTPSSSHCSTAYTAVCKRSKEVIALSLTSRAHATQHSVVRRATHTTRCGPTARPPRDQAWLSQRLGPREHRTGGGLSNSALNFCWRWRSSLGRRRPASARTMTF